MKRGNSFLLASVILMAIPFLVLFFGHKSKPVVHDTDYYANALVADQAIIPGLPSAEEIIAAEGEKLAKLFLKTAGAYNDFAVQTKDKSNVLSSYEKYAYYNYRAGVVYLESLHDNKTACWYYGGALSADGGNPLYKKNYDSPVRQVYRSK